MPEPSSSKKWLLCLFSYNRAALLANAIRSIDQFFPIGDRLIVDDGSNDLRVHQLLEQTSRAARWKFKIMGRVAGRTYGGFYANMRYALEYALENGYDYCFFFEDDQQMVWKKGDYEAYVERVFSLCPDAIQIQPLLARRILDYSVSMEYIRSAHAYRTDRGFNTTAIWNLEAVRTHPDYQLICAHGDDLPLNSAYWLKQGYRVYFQFDPTVAIAPWTNSQSLFHAPGTIIDAKDEGLFLNPLSESEIHFLQFRHPSIAPYQEYFNLSAENVRRPIWHQQGQNLNRFFSLCRKIVETEDVFHQSPGRIPILDQWQPTRIPPVRSHLTWKPAPSAVPVTYRLGSRWGKRIERWIDWMRFSPRDYLGYRELTHRLRKEQMNLGDYLSDVR